MFGFFRILSGFTAINFCRSLIPFVLLPILTRALSPGEYGALSVFEATILVLAPLVLFNSPSFVGGRYYKVAPDEVAEINLNALVTCVLFYCIAQAGFFACAGMLRSSLGLEGSFLLWMPVFVLARVLNTYIGNLWQVQHNVRAYGVFSVGTLLLDLGLSLYFVLSLHWGYQGRLAGSHVALFVFAAAGIYQFRRTGLLHGRVTSHRMREIFKYGLPMISHSIGGVSMALATRYILANQLGSAAVGQYTVAYQIASVMLLVGTSINQAWSGFLFRLLGDKGGDVRKTIIALMTALVGVLCIACVVLLLLQDVLFAAFAGPQFAAAKQFFPYLLVAFLFQSVYFVFVNFDFYDERVISIGATTLFTAALNIVLNLVLIPRFGVLGAAYATLLTMALYMALVIARVVAFNKSFRLVWFP